MIFCRVSVYNKRETMTETRENSFDGYVSAADGGRGLSSPEGPRRSM